MRLYTEACKIVRLMKPTTKALMAAMHGQKQRWSVNNSCSDAYIRGSDARRHIAKLTRKFQADMGSKQYRELLLSFYSS